MSLIKYCKAKPTEFILHYSKNKLCHEGAGISFFYYGPTSNVVSVPINSNDLPFIFNEITSDYQPVTIQGQLTFQIVEPKMISEMLDFTIDHKGRHTSDDPGLLRERIVNLTQVAAKGIVSQITLKETLVSSVTLVEKILQELKRTSSIRKLGIEILDINILSIKTTPEMTKALESATREALQRQSDQAIYQRRNAAVEEERTIKENELKTEIKLEQEKRKIREAKISADIAVEQQRETLIEKQVANDKKKADGDAYALSAFTDAIKNTDWQKLVAAFSGGKLDSGLMVAMAFHEMAENASKIGELNIGPDVMKSLMPNRIDAK